MGHPTLLTKMLNDVSPTGTRLKKMKHDVNAKCPLCGAEEDFDHILQCKHPSRAKWKHCLIKNLRNTMQKWNTKESLSDTFDSALTDWMDTDEVTCSTQNWMATCLHWTHFTRMGKCRETQWTGQKQCDHAIGPLLLWHALTKTVQPHDWASAVVTCVLEHVINSWETRNEELHGKSKTEQNQRMLQRQKEIISKLLLLKNKCLARDHFLFPSDSSSLMEETSTDKLANWIATRTQLIKVSVQQALKTDAQRTDPLTKWFAPQTTASSKSSESQVKQWTQNQLLHDPHNAPNFSLPSPQTT